jgi:hypothetical protein
VNANGTLFLSGDYGIYKSTDSAKTWSKIQTLSLNNGKIFAGTNVGIYAATFSF